MATRALIKTSGINTRTATPISSVTLDTSEGSAEALVVAPIDVVGRTKYEMTGGMPDYVGVNAAANASESSNDWAITRYQWSGDDLQDKQTLIGSWANRASLGWV